MPFLAPTRRVVRAAALWLTLLLVGCAGVPEAPVVEETLPQTAREARAAMAAGKAERAAALWMQAARQHPERAVEFLLEAAEAWLRAGAPEQARRILAGLAEAPLSPPQEARLGLLAARIAHQEHDAGAVLQALDFDPSVLPERDRILYHRLRAEAFLENGNYLESARERVALDALLKDDAARIENELAIWEALNHLSTHALELLETPDTLGGWIALTRILRQHAADPQSLELALEAWRMNWPDHPAEREFLARLQERRRTLIQQRPRRITVLLPLSGRLAQAGSAVQDGIVAAYYQQVQADPELRVDFRDTEGEPNRIWSLYHEARAAGAEFVIGPLQRASVLELARSGELAIPVLALNRIPDRDGTDAAAPPPGFFQFPLAPEDEAAAVAEHAAQRGYLRSLALLPEGERGRRLLDAYLEHWESRGSAYHLLEAGTYPKAPRRLSETVRRLLNIDSSQRRYQELVRTLGLRPQFEPRARKDADHVFLVANPVMGRLLKPLLRFHRASHLPVLATSSIYSGRPAPELDRDLDGIEFCDIPWLIAPSPTMEQARRELEKVRRSPASLLRLNALGYDALTLPPLLPALRAGLLPSHAGATGRLRMDGEGRLHRELAWARMENGMPRLLYPRNPYPVESAQGGALDEGRQSPDSGQRGGTPGLPLSAPPGASPAGPELSQPLR